MDVIMPDGTVIRGVPEGTPKEDVMRRYQRKKAFREKPAFEKEAEAIKNTSATDLIWGSAPGRFVAGAADIGIGGFELVLGLQDVRALQEHCGRGSGRHLRQGFYGAQLPRQKRGRYRTAG